MFDNYIVMDEIERPDKVNDAEERGYVRNIMRPREIVDYLDKYVIGQDRAKKTLALAVYNHYKRALSNIHWASPLPELDDVVIEKSNVLLAGHTGTGKTYMLKTISKALGIPCYIADATKVTESGYVGDDVETMLVGLLRECDYDVNMAQMGILVVDEIDKLSRKGENVSITRDVGGEGVQQGLLKIVEGGIVGVPPMGGRKHPDQPLVYIDTSNILFIGMGAFDGLDRIVERRINTKSVGFLREEMANDDGCFNPLSMVTAEDLKTFGMIPELIGRFPVVTYTDDLSRDDLVRILKEPKNSLVKQYRKLFLMDGVDIHFNDDALYAMADRALELNIGARGLRSMMEKVLADVMYDSFNPESYGKNIIVTSEMVADTLVKRKAA